MANAQNKSQTTYKEITQSQLIQAVSDANKKGSCVKYGFILGAGASVNSGIKAGGWFAEKWFKEIKGCIDESALREWTNSIDDFDDTNLAAFYTKLFDKRFETNYTLGYQELQRHMDKAKPSIGYSFLAQVLAQTANKFVITTNFDTMTEDALFDLKDAKPLVLGHELLSGFINANSPTRPTIVKIHRDFLFDPYNSDSQIEEMDAQWQKALAPVLQENAMIVIGYGGNDESLMGYLEKIESRKPIYWCCRDINRISDRIKQLLNKNDFVIKIESFDKFMLLLSDKLGFNSLIDKENINNSEIVKSAVARAINYAKQLENLAEKDLGKEEQAAIKKLLPSWWKYELKVQQETNNDKKDKIYCEGLKAYPKSHELMNNYANFLTDVRKDYDQAESFYLKALKLEPDNASNTGNYAIFLTYVRKDHDQAESFYLKALKLEPDNASNTGNYAIFLTDVRKDHDQAEKFYLKALELEPDNASNTGNYANFLKNVRKDYDQAEKFYLKALKLKPDDAELNGNYANFLNHVRKDYDQAESFYLKALKLEPDNTNNTGNYADFLNHVRKDYDQAESFYLKALELEPDNANKIGNYAIFLKNVRKDYDQAERFYLKALELEPEDANTNACYAQFLLERGESTKAASYLKTAFKNMEEENDLKLELWFYRLAHFPEFYKEAKTKLDQLLADGHRSIGWNFDGNITQAEKENFQDIDLLNRYAKKITEE
ncbi:MAG: tetratricopeptide repeat protein [Thiomicrorhabdus sp.]|nr:tetratricopeptide repeat protein [Thiomicrorhabdus sp.]